MLNRLFYGLSRLIDFILIFILGSMLSRAINGSAPFLATIGAAFVLVLFHRFLAALCFHFHRIGALVKGTDDVIIADGQVKPEALRKHYLSEGDLLEDLRLRSVSQLSEVKEARLERSGDLSVLPKGA